MICELMAASRKVGLNINFAKTKILTNSGETSYTVENQVIDVVENFNYLGQQISFEDQMEKEINVRITNAWRSFWAQKKFFKGNLPIFCKKRLMDSTILPVLTYGAQAWSLNKDQEKRIQVEQRSMERCMLGVRMTDHVTNEALRAKSGIKDALEKAKELKWDFAGHVQRRDDANLTKKIENWVPSDGSRKIGRQQKRWRDEIEKIGLATWRKKANQREKWKNMRMSFVQQWAVNDI
jgi:hypothetical protein